MIQQDLNTLQNFNMDFCKRRASRTRNGISLDDLKRLGNRLELPDWNRIKLLRKAALCSYIMFYKPHILEFFNSHPINQNGSLALYRVFITT